MSLNTAHANNGVLIHAGEYILLFSDNVQMEFIGQDNPVFKSTKNGRIYLTSHRMIFNAKNQSEPMQSFSFPFVTLNDVDLEQPVFGANYIKGKVRAQPNGNWSGEVKFKLYFKSGGAIDYGQALLRAAKTAQSNMHSDAPPPYTPPTGSWYEAPAPAYQPPPGYYGWLPNNPEYFGNPTSGGGIFMSDNPPPYPGINTPQSGYNGAPPQQGYPGAPPQGYPGAPSHGYPGAPPQQGYPGAPPQGYPGAPPSQGYPGAPPSQGYPGAPPSQGYAGFQAPGGFSSPQGYPGAPSQNGYPGYQPPGSYPGAPPSQNGYPGFQGASGNPSSQPSQGQFGFVSPSGGQSYPSAPTSGPMGFASGPPMSKEAEAAQSSYNNFSSQTQNNSNSGPPHSGPAQNLNTHGGYAAPPGMNELPPSYSSATRKQ